MRLILLGRVPSKKNSKRFIQRGAKRFLVPSEAFEAWHEEQLLRLRLFRPKEPIARAAVTITFFADTYRPFDLSNAAESVMDLLVDAGVLTDDAWKFVPHLSLHFGAVEPKNARAEVDITPLDDRENTEEDIAA